MAIELGGGQIGAAAEALPFCGAQGGVEHNRAADFHAGGNQRFGGNNRLFNQGSPPNFGLFPED